ncbi:MAG: acyl-CoA dehydrogenase family protein [Myxococcales bacterium]|nr:acyl-CoA dehydrogenase family protein [Myxococcales bacterium]
MTQLEIALQRLLMRPVPAPLTQLEDWWQRERRLREELGDPTARAIVLAGESGRLGLAFAGGFHAALARLGGGLDPCGVRRVAFCATEAEGAHPRAIKTSLAPEGSGFRIHGEKTWATLGGSAEELLVVCRQGERSDGRPKLVVARVDATAPGVTRTAARPTPFCPEITHCGFGFDTVIDGADLLPGDGYADYLKPFRTVEDSHVQLAVCAYFIGVSGRLGLAPAWSEVLSALLLSCWSVAGLDPKQSTTHAALAGLERQVAELIPGFEEAWSDVGGAEWHAWERDRALLRVAQGARDARREAARRQLASRMAAVRVEA